MTDSPATDAALSFDPAPLAVQAYLDILAAPTAEAGSGSAACLVLAMAFGCLEKAAALTFKHHPERTEMSAVIAQLARLRRQSLDAAADEATCFAEFTRESSATNAPTLARAERTALSLTDRATEFADSLAGTVDENVRGDLFAARSLIHAAIQIFRSNSQNSVGSR